MVNKKIFCVGFNKTGTTTLNAIFRTQLNINSGHKPKWTYWTYKPNDPRLAEYDAFTDGETPAIRLLQTNYPDALFILNTRPLKSWLVSRHKATERSKAAVSWMFTKFIPARFIAKFINKRILVNTDQAITRWIQIRNSYHRFALQTFEGSDNFIVLNIEDQNMLSSLASFLETDQKLQSQKDNINGNGSITSTVLDSIGRKKSKVNSEEVIDAYLAANKLMQHAENLTYFDHPQYWLTESPADRICRILPFFKPVFRGMFMLGVNFRGKSKSYLSKTIADKFIGWSRSEEDMNYYTSVSRFGSGSR
ncbi:MAG: sulfotransferase [Cyclobacteriaceae bacterium]